MFLSELNKSEVFFGISRKLIERYVDIDLFKIFSITIVLFYETRSTDLGSDDDDSCQKYPKLLKLCRQNYVNICPQHHMESHCPAKFEKAVS